MVAMRKIEKLKYPNKIAEKAKISKEFKEPAEAMAKDIVQEFLPLCDIPHPSGHVEEMRQYLLD